MEQQHDWWILIKMLDFVKIGSDIPQTVEVDEVAEEFFGFKKPSKVLIVEGNSDKTCIEMFYHMTAQKPIYEVRTASMLNNEGSVDGKKLALNYYEQNKQSPEQEIRLLLDRDYDLILDINKKDKDIFYYDYYELENYLFDTDILKKFIGISMETFTSEHFDEVLKKLNSNLIESSLFLFYKMALIRELHFNGKLMGIEIREIKKYSLILKNISIHSILEGKNPKAIGESYDERIQNFWENSLNEIDPGLFEQLDNFWNKNKYNTPSTFLDFSQNFFKGKILIKSLKTLFNFLGITDLKFDNFNVTKFLLNDWIFQCETYTKKISEIENSFI